MLIVTTDTISGRSIDTVIGEVVGLTARTLNPFAEGIKRVDGLSAAREIIPSLLRWRRDAIANLAAEAELLGADAVVGMKFDSRILSSAWTEICAYGTAVRLVPAVFRAESGIPPVGGRPESIDDQGQRYLPGGRARSADRPGSAGSRIEPTDVDPASVDPSGIDPSGIDLSAGGGGIAGDGT
jgi:uncharacterized protein YbjQ (UPF0145 family)